MARLTRRVNAAENIVGTASTAEENAAFAGGIAHRLDQIAAQLHSLHEAEDQALTIAAAICTNSGLGLYDRVVERLRRSQLLHPDEVAARRARVALVVGRFDAA